MFTAILAFSIGAPAAPQFQVENKCPCQFVVVNKVVPKKMPANKGCVCGDDCKCAAGDCPAKCPVQAAPAQGTYQLVARQGRFGRTYYEYRLVQPQQTVGGITCVNGTCTSFK